MSETRKTKIKSEDYEENAGNYEECFNTYTGPLVKKDDKDEETNMKNHIVGFDEDYGKVKEESTFDNHFVKETDEAHIMNQMECSANSKEKTQRMEEKANITDSSNIITQEFEDNSNTICTAVFLDSNDSSLDEKNESKIQNLRSNKKIERLSLQKLKERDKTNVTEIKEEKRFAYSKDFSFDVNMDVELKEELLTNDHFENNHESYLNGVDRVISSKASSDASTDILNNKYKYIQNGNIEFAEEKCEEKRKGNEEEEEEEEEEGENEEEETEEEETEEEETEEEETEEEEEEEEEEEGESNSDSDSDSDSDTEEEEVEYDPDDFSCNLATAVPLTDGEPYVFDYSSLLDMNIYSSFNNTLADLRKENAKNQRKIRKLAETPINNESKLFNLLFSDKSNKTIKYQVSKYKFPNIYYSSFPLDVLFSQHRCKKSIDDPTSEFSSFGKNKGLDEVNTYHISKNFEFKLYKDPEMFIQKEEKNKMLFPCDLEKSYNEYLITNPMSFGDWQEFDSPLLLSGFKLEDSYTYDNSSIWYLFSSFFLLCIIGIVIFLISARIKSNFI